MEMVGGDKLLDGNKMIPTLIHNVHIFLIIMSRGTKAHMQMSQTLPTPPGPPLMSPVLPVFRILMNVDTTLGKKMRI